MQGLLDLYESPRYLEVGVYEGETFRALEAGTKVAVDPCFRFDVSEGRLDDSHSVFHEVTSDEYFARIAERRERFDVIFLDGLHTFEQTLRDFNSAVLLLAEHGVLMIDDVRPTSSLAAISDRKRFEKLRRVLESDDGAWMGDVYRLVFFIDAFCPQFTFRTVAETNCQLIAWRQPREEIATKTVEEVARMTYEDIHLAREHFHIAPYEEILDEVRELAKPLRRNA